jgi:hypothetical protein
VSLRSITFVGAGVSSRLLALALLEREPPERLCFVDPDDPAEDERVYTLFDDGELEQQAPGALVPLPAPTARFAGGGSEVLGMGRFRFFRARLAGLWERVLQRSVERGVEVELVRRSVHDAADVPAAELVLDARPPAAPGPIVQRVRTLVVTVDGALPPPMWMDFAASSVGDRFVHHVPLDREQLFVQLVRYGAPEATLPDLDDLARSLGHDRFEVQVDEDASLALLPPGDDALPGALRVGAGAGWVRPASGYGVRRCFRFARSLAHALAIDVEAANARPTTVRAPPALDRVLLRVLGEEPTLLASLFENMVERAGASGALVRFLEEDASVGDLVEVAGGLPAGLFVRAALAEGLRPGDVLPGR